MSAQSPEQSAASWEREDKLLAFAVVVYGACALIHAFADRIADGEAARWWRIVPIALWFAVHEALRRIHPSSWRLAIGCVVGAAVLLVRGWASQDAVALGAGVAVVAAGLAAAGSLPRWTAGLVLPLTAAIGLVGVGPTRSPLGLGWLLALAGVGLLGIPAAQFYRAAGHSHAGTRRFGAAGLHLVAGFLGLSVTGLGLADPPALAAYLLAVTAFHARLRTEERDHYDTPVRRVQRLSVTIITKNEEDRLWRCLDSVNGWADEIIVLDSGSTDGTVALARRYTERVYVTDWPGYGPQKQRALERATGDWVLSIDADEEVTPELRHDIDEALGAAPVAVGYRLPWGVHVYGKRLDFGRSARAPLRLFRREGSRFTDAQVHETVILPPGLRRELRGRLTHHTQRDFGHALEKVARYGWLGAIKRFEAGKSCRLAGATLRAAWVFVQVYGIRLGCLDGGPGFLTAMLYAEVTFNKYAGLWALRRDRATLEP